LSLVPAKSVVDVAVAYLTCGVDGDYADRSKLRIPPERFPARNLTKPDQSQVY
jgi:hypothetical protein